MINDRNNNANNYSIDSLVLYGTCRLLKNY